jgi:thiol:disulfide interchange protein DsbD
MTEFAMFHRMFLLFCLSWVLAATAQAQPRQTYADVSIISERDVVVAGETVYAAFQLDLVDGWHVYWRNPGDAGLPPEADWRQGGDLVGEFIWPVPHELEVIPGELMDYGYEDRLVLPFSVTVPAVAAAAVSLEGTLRYLICKEICIPEEAEFSLELPIGASAITNQRNGRLIGDAIGLAPVPLGAEACLSAEADEWVLSVADSQLARAHAYLRFFPYENEIKHAADQPSTSGSAGVQITLTPGYGFESAPPEMIEGVLVSQIAGMDEQSGYEISSKRCAPLAGTSGGGQGAGSLQAAGGTNVFVLAWWALLGGIILNLMPCVLPVLSMKVIGVVSAATEGDGRHLKAHGLWYTAGVLVTFAAIAALFVGLRSAGQFLPVGFQLQNATTVAALALLMFVIGLWLLGMFELGNSVQGVGSGLAERNGAAGAFFTGLLAAIVGAPCIGPFLGVAIGALSFEPAWVVFLVFLLVGLGLALPFLLISFVPNLQRFLPKPGAWMERLKQFFAFPMFLSALWLVSILGDLAGMDAIIGVGIGAVAIAFGIWLLSTRSDASRLLFGVLGGAVILAGSYFALQGTWGAGPASTSGTLAASGYGEQVEPVTWSQAAVDTALDSGQGVFVDFTASWCATCQLNKRTTLRKASVQAAFEARDVVFMIADFTRQDADIAEALKRHKRPGVPMYLYYAPGSRSPVLLPQLLSEALIMEQLGVTS